MSAKPAKHDVPILWKRIHPYMNAGSAKIIAAVALVAIGGAVIMNLPDAPASSSVSTNSLDTPTTTVADLPAQETSAAAGDALCEKQAWPYIDQRCREAVQSREGTRAVRVVTDRGASSTAFTPIPIVEPKPPAPAPAPQPVVANADTSIGPRVAPPMPEGEQDLAAAVESSTPERRVEPLAAPRAEPVAAPRVEPVAAKQPAAPQPESLQTTVSVQPNRPQPPESKQAVVSVQPARPQPSVATTGSLFSTPAAATETSQLPDEDAATKAKLKAEAKVEKLRAAEAARAEQRAKSVRSLERRGLPPEVIAAVEAAVAEQRGASVNVQGGSVQIAPRRARNREAVPDEVIAAVEAAARERRSSGRRVVEADGQYITLGAPGRGDRVYLVPRESFGRGW